MRRIGAALAAAALAVAAAVSAATAGAWPGMLSDEQRRLIDDAHTAGFPGDDNAILAAGAQVCQDLMAGLSREQMMDRLAAAYGSSPQAAAALIQSARWTVCLDPPG